MGLRIPTFFARVPLAGGKTVLRHTWLINVLLAGNCYCLTYLLHLKMLVQVGHRDLKTRILVINNKLSKSNHILAKSEVNNPSEIDDFVIFFTNFNKFSSFFGKIKAN